MARRNSKQAASSAAAIARPSSTLRRASRHSARLVAASDLHAGPLLMVQSTAPGAPGACMLELGTPDQAQA